jgi:hypothetical protein
MIPYEELDRALARWRGRAQGGGGGAVDTTHEVTDSAATVVSEYPTGSNGVPGRTGDHTGEIDLESQVVETYDDENER